MKLYKIKKLGTLINKERKDKGLSLRDFAKMVGLSHVAISHIEKGKVEAKKDTLLNIARVLEYDVDAMLAKASKLSIPVLFATSDHSFSPTNKQI